MKYLLSFLFLAVCVPAFAAIEFSEELDQFAPATSAVSAADAEGPAAAESEAPSIRSAGNATASNAAVTSAQSTGVVGNMNGPLGSAGVGATSMLGGGGALNGQADEVAERSDDLVAEAEGEERGGDTSSLMAEPPASEAFPMPEPSTAIVWGLLAVCGFGAYRNRR